MKRAPVPSQSDAEYLRADQYKDTRNLDARLAIHRFSVHPQGWAPWLFDRLLEAVPAGNARLLELGCGMATMWRENAARVPAGWSLHLTDFSAGMIAASSAVLGGRARYALADARALPFPDRHFDVVVANHMLYHVPERPRALREIRRVLASGGMLFASSVGERHMVELDEHLQAIGFDGDLQGRAMSAGFTLENGGAQLAEVFGDVRLERYPDSLRVPTVEPLLAYVRSMRIGAVITEEEIARLREGFAAEIARCGHVAIFKDSGVFVARGT